MSLIKKIIKIRVNDPGAIALALQQRKRATVPADDTKLMIIAADHPARGALTAGGDSLAMANREDLLHRCLEALSRPGVHGFLGTADMVEDLTLLGALEGKLVYGSMNRGGIAGAAFEMDDRFTGYDAAGVADSHLDGGKMLLRINYSDPATVGTIESSTKAVNELAERSLVAMVEPFISRWQGSHIVNDLSPEAVIRSIAISAGLGRTSAFTWLKLPYVQDMERVVETSSLPALILGGEVAKDPDAALKGWSKALELPTVKGLVIGRSLLYPARGDVSAAVDEAVSLL